MRLLTSSSVPSSPNVTHNLSIGKLLSLGPNHSICQRKKILLILLRVEALQSSFHEWCPKAGMEEEAFFVLLIEWNFLIEV